MNQAAAAQAQELTHKICAIVLEPNEDTSWEPPSGSGQGPRVVEQYSGGQGRKEHERNDIKSGGRTVDSRIMARPPPGARANPLALWR